MSKASRVRPASSSSALPISKAISHARKGLSHSRAVGASLFSSTQTGPLTDVQLANALVDAEGTFRKEEDDTVVISKASEIHAKAQAVVKHVLLSSNSSPSGNVPLPYVVLHRTKGKNPSLIILCDPNKSDYYSILDMRLDDENTTQTIVMSNVAEYDPIMKSMAEKARDRVAKARTTLGHLSISATLTISRGKCTDVSLVELVVKGQSLKGQSAGCRVHLEEFCTLVNSLATHFFRGAELDERNKRLFIERLSEGLPAPTKAEKALCSVAQERVRPIAGWKRLKGTVSDPVEKFCRDPQSPTLIPENTDVEACPVRSIVHQGAQSASVHPPLGALAILGELRDALDLEPVRVGGLEKPVPGDQSWRHRRVQVVKPLEPVRSPVLLGVKTATSEKQRE